jgi:large subunit ribosomal protein L4
MQRALSARLADGEILAVETIALAEPKTKLMVGYLRGLGIDETATKLLILTGEGERDSVLRASNNLSKVRTRVAPNVGIVDVLWADRILCTSGALKTLEETLGR